MDLLELMAIAPSAHGMGKIVSLQESSTFPAGELGALV